MRDKLSKYEPTRSDKCNGLSDVVVGRNKDLSLRTKKRPCSACIHEWSDESKCHDEWQEVDESEKLPKSEWAGTKNRYPEYEN